MRDGDGRNNELFHRALRLARGASSREELSTMVATANAAFAEPMSDAEVGRITESVWGYKGRGRLLVAGSEASAGVTPTEMAMLGSDPDALALLLRLRAAHGWQLGRTFALVAQAMAGAMAIHHTRIRKARDKLVATYFLEIVSPGGRSKHDPMLARLL